LKDKPHEFSGYLTGQMIMATPQMTDKRFERALIYICGHDAQGAMGLILNKYIEDLTLKSLLQQLGLPTDKLPHDSPIHFGGPMDNGRGFVLHTDDYIHPATVHLFENLAMTATLDVLQSIANKEGPEQCLVAMGYAGWGAGQLESELSENVWMEMDPDFDLIFNTPVERKWDLGMTKMGLDVAILDPHVGQA